MSIVESLDVSFFRQDDIRKKLMMMNTARQTWALSLSSSSRLAKWSRLPDMLRPRNNFHLVHLKSRLDCHLRSKFFKIKLWFSPGSPEIKVWFLPEIKVWFSPCSPDVKVWFWPFSPEIKVCFFAWLTWGPGLIITSFTWYQGLIFIWLTWHHVLRKRGCVECTKYSRLLAVGSGTGIVEEWKEKGEKWAKVYFET